MRGVWTTRPHPHVSPRRTGLRDANAFTASQAVRTTRASPAATSAGDICANPPGVWSASPTLKDGAGPATPTSGATNDDSRGTISKAPMLKTRHATASTTMPARMDHEASWAAAASGERGMARNVMPKALTKQAAQSPAVRASMPSDSTISTATRGDGAPMPGRSDWKSSHSETKPLSGGSPEMAAEPTRKSAAVHGMPRIRPPRRFMSRMPVAWSTAPAPRKRRPLKTAWLTVW